MATHGMSNRHQARVKEFDNGLAGPVLDLQYIQQQCFNGIPEGGGRRSFAWRVLLNYLPLQKSLWPDFLSQKRNLYKQLVDEIILATPDSNSPVIEDHPLNPNPASHWQSFFKDNEVLLQIDKDVRRLCPDISFFSQATNFPNLLVVGSNGCPGREKLHQRVTQAQLKSQSLERKGVGPIKMAAPKKRAMEDYAPLKDGQEAHWEVVERILFLYAKLNPGQGYVQGMNEIIGPIYYVFASDSRIEWRENAEADCFFCFTSLMADIRDFFIKTLDEAETGITAMMMRLKGRLAEHDQETSNLLVDQDIRPQYFAFRWLSLMLSQEFPLPEVLRMWDALLSDNTRCDLLIDVCTGMILLIRDQLLTNDFATNMKLLQNYPSMDVHVILSKAKSLSNKS